MRFLYGQNVGYGPTRGTPIFKFVHRLVYSADFHLWQMIATECMHRNVYVSM